jgi:hypothetical protein
MTVTFPLVHCQEKPSGRDCPGLSTVTANGLTLSCAKPKEVQNLQVSGYKMLSNYTCSLHVALRSELPALEHAVIVVKCPLFCPKRYS